MNPIITLPAGDAALITFDQYLALPDRCYFLILGQGSEQQKLLQQAQKHSQSWRWGIWAPDAQALYTRLQTLHLRPGVLPLLPTQLPYVLGMSISTHNVICRVVTEVGTNTVSSAFIMAEGYLQP
jgi:hypothetical protein